jgi:C4-dicarboxylate transporter DctM subunit
MILTIAVTFFGLLIFGFPIAFVVLISAAIGVIFFTNISPLILIQQLFNGLDNYVLLGLPFFLVSGNIAAEGETARRIVGVMNLVFGRLPGGLVIATIFSCAFFAAISGSSLATVVAIGTIMIPILEEAGYGGKMSIGAVTSAGSLGILIPPSNPMILFCVALGTSVGRQFMAGFLPGIFLAFLMGCYTYIHCKKNPPKKKVVAILEGTKIRKDSIYALMYPVIILGTIYGGVMTPTEASALSLIYILVIEVCVYKKVKVRNLAKILNSSAVNCATLVIIIACAMTFSWFVTVKQIPYIITDFISNIIPTRWLFILSLLIFYFIAGCFMETISLTVVMAPILLPTLQKFDVNLIHFGIIAIVNAEVGFLTPPFGLNLFVAMSITHRSLWEVARYCLPYMLTLLVGAIIIAYVPEISLFLPNLFLGKY